MKEIAVIYLLRESNNINLIKKFLNSYIKYDAGIEHTLVLILKGFKNNSLDTNSANLLKNFNYLPIYIDDTGFDLDAYFNTANKFNYDYYIFFNSYSEILSENWLLKYYNICSKEHVGIVGATGSYESPTRNWREEYFIKKNIYSFTIIKWLKLFKHLIYLKFLYPEFPNPHIRTNAFMICSKNLKMIKYNFKLNRDQALQLESGKNSITNQLIKLKLLPLIIDKNGKSYNIVNWKESATFRWSNQENLLISDNRTNMFYNLNNFHKKKLIDITWF